MFHVLSWILEGPGLKIRIQKIGATRHFFFICPAGVPKTRPKGPKTFQDGPKTPSRYPPGSPRPPKTPPKLHLRCPGMPQEISKTLQNPPRQP